MKLNYGLTARNTGPDISAFMLAHPEMELGSSLVGWGLLQPTAAGLSTDVLNKWDRSINALCGIDAQMITRIACGASSPVYIEKAPNPVKFIDLYSNDPNPAYAGRKYHLPKPWEPNLLVHWRQTMQLVAKFFNGPCPRDPSHTRMEHIHSLPLALPTEDGTEMTWGYGKDPYRANNIKTWDAISTVSERQTKLRDTWWNALVEFLGIDPNWRCSVAGGHLMEDQLAGANWLLDKILALPEKDKSRVLVMITNLSTAEKWPVAQKNLANWLDRAAAGGLKLGLQSAGTAILPAGDFDGFKSGIEYALKRYGNAINYFEPQPTRIAPESREYQYMLEVQERMQPARFSSGMNNAGQGVVLDRKDKTHYAIFNGSTAEIEAKKWASILNGT